MLSQRVTVLIADDMVELRSNVRRMLANQGNIEIVGECSDGEEALKIAKELSPHVILMDINMPKLDGLKATEILAKERPEIQVVIMSIQSEQEYFRRAMKAGGKDYLVKPFSASELIDTIQNVFNKWVKDRLELEKATSPKAFVFTFFSTKGGVGKTTLAVNLAVNLAMKGKKTLLIDCSLQFGDVACTLNLAPVKNLYTLIKKEDMDYQGLERSITQHSSGLHLLLAPAEPAFAEEIKAQNVKQVLELALPRYQFIIIDTPPHIGEVELAILDQTDLVLLTATLEISSLKNTKLVLKTFSDITFEKEKLKLILNKEIQNVGIDCKDIEAGLAIPIFATIPMDSETAQRSLNQGEPFVVKFPESALSNAIEKIVSQVSVDEKDPKKAIDDSVLFKLRRILFGAKT
ncbi:response regulator [bacterium]|nr:response regulator [bacterium]